MDFLSKWEINKRDRKIIKLYKIIFFFRCIFERINNSGKIIGIIIYYRK